MRQLIQPHLLGIDTGHAPGFRFDSPGAIDETCLVMCFRTPVRILTRNGVETGAPGCCILHSLDFREYHFSVPGSREGFRNDWLKAAFEVVSPIVAELKLPYDTLLPTGRPDLLESGIAAIRAELENPDGYSDTAVRLLLHQLLLAIRRAYTEEMRCRTVMTPSERDYYPAFRKICDSLRKEYRREFRIGSLAAEVNLSPERFSVLYRKFFGRSPYAELIDARILAAKRLLTSTAFTVKEISAMCGWQDQYYFSRLFKEKCAVSPRDFRRHYNRYAK
ncbi:AraC family transcriptional regulator [uncultured Victivallis sp.]|uniref:helix-turn-helix transcriptional regulator n=1 Tax=uncultured Victivallis sp. TaxID=354118 RepID=UPI00258BDD3B|nr:AraC family transcriptional regulator [uncultured Victivallis sp.]